jgi:UDP-N-acetylglucosamine acyltransferase
MCGAGTVVLKDIPAFVMSQGYPAQPHGINSEGLKRRGFEKDSITRIRAAYKTLYRQNLTLAEAKEVLAEEAAQDSGVAMLLDSLNAATRGIIR